MNELSYIYISYYKRKLISNINIRLGPISINIFNLLQPIINNIKLIHSYNI
ncbi:MAG: NADH-quinone oxidoreductase subunit H [Pseudoalteromonas sp.]|nr:NADH-quinone oxidoreductase subunit H [Pseudoalteromonas sp.]